MKLLFGLGILLGFILSVAAACRSKKPVVDPLSAPAIIWGNGGGFTGKEVTFGLLENGKIYKSEGMNAGTPFELKPVKAKVAKAMFSAARDLNLLEVSLNSSGNMYHFVELQANGKPHRITWGDKQAELPQKVKDFYVLLNQLVTKGTD